MTADNHTSGQLESDAETQATAQKSPVEYPLLKTLINQLPDLIYVKDAKSRYLMANDATARFFALDSPESLRGKTDFDLQPIDMAEQYYADEQTVLSTGKAQINREEPIIDHQTGTVRWQLSTKVPFYDAQGDIAGIVGINRDITDRKRMEAQLLTAHTELRDTNAELAQLNASKDKFLSIVSHDLRSPLTVLLGLSQLIDENVARYPTERIKLYTRELRDSAETLYTLLENLLTWSRVQRNVLDYLPQELDIHDLADEAFDLFAPAAKQKTITLQNAAPPGMQIYADYAMTYTVLRNLVSNAVKFTPPGGRITISARQDDAEIEVSVTDSGIGIPEEGLVKLFRIDVRYTRPGTDGEEGTGLGLPLCQDLIKKNNGTIWAESCGGQGSTFSFRLPRPATSPEE